MSELNPSQRRMAETLDGMIVVDAGPGTGKTHTIVERYINLISRDDVSPRDVLMLTFTRNAAAEMEERIKGRMSELDMRDDSKLVQVKTFDSFCLSVVMESPEEAGSLFGIDERLTHAVALVENETLNKAFFRSFLNDFLDSRGEDYGDWGVLGSQEVDGIYDLIQRLMAKGIFPVKGRGWFGGDNGRELVGDTDLVLSKLYELNEETKKGSPLANAFRKDVKEKPNDFDISPDVGELDPLPDDALRDAAKEDRGEMLRFIHDVYWQFVRKCISEDRLTFGVNAMLAFSVLYTNARVRSMNSYRYVMIDEFQDTNASQLMMSLMIMKEPNLCVVGDWKQGIFGFRFVSVDNILHFEERATELRRQLNDDQKRVQFSIPEPSYLPLDVNYRSSKLIIDRAFDCMKLPATKEEKLDLDEIESHLVRLEAKLDATIGDETAIRYIQCESNDDEAEMVAKVIRDYVGSGKYRVLDKRTGEFRAVRLGDIAVLCRKTQSCRQVSETLAASGIPAFLQGDVEIMSTREGKLALAWLRYLNNERDPWGYVPIMADMGYSMADCRMATKFRERVPEEITLQRQSLYRRRRRITDLLSTMFSWYGLDNDVTQSIISVLSSAHRNSLLTISDLVSIIEEDIASATAYPVEMDLGSDAVKIMTMHKSKGLEFPIVIIPYMDFRTMPSNMGDRSVFSFDEDRGVRCSKTIGKYDGYSKITKSWRSWLVRRAFDKDYDEERRLMFVAMSRAIQYETLICGNRPSRFIEGLSDGEYVGIDDTDLVVEQTDHVPIAKPDVSGYRKRTPSIGVHSVMAIDPLDGQGGMTEADELSGKGMEYGSAVHQEAQYLHQGLPPSGRYPESLYIMDIVLSRRSMDGFIKSYAEVDCSLPIEGGGFTLRGVVDLLLVFEDRVEIHDYKTDVSDRFQSEYELQLSIYAESARQFYGDLPVRCFIDYVSQERSVEFEPMSLERISAIVVPREEGLRHPLRRSTPNA